MAESPTGTLQRLRVTDLLLDWENPRLPEVEQGAPEEQLRLAQYINKHYDPLRIAESIATHQFFDSEPLIAEPHGDRYRVIEGNRRLTALLGLSNGEMRAAFALENSGWDRLPPEGAPERVPVLVVQDRKSVAPLLGFRHISGIEPWEPHAQARYLANLVDSGSSLEEVAETVGKSATEVRSMYRNYEILKQGESQFGLDTSRARASFGVFHNAMGRTALRDYISAPPPRHVDPEYWPLPDDKAPQLDELLRFIFGGDDGAGQVVHDSRHLGVLSKVLADSSGRGLAALRTGQTLDEAVEAIDDPEARQRRYLQRALDQLNAARVVSDDIPEDAGLILAQISASIADWQEDDISDRAVRQ